MTRQSTWIPHDPPLQLNDRVKISDTCWSKHRGKVGTIKEILSFGDAEWIRTDRWTADWYRVELEDKTIPSIELGFLEDELVPVKG